VREGLSRTLWLALILSAFCVPLLLGLGGTDVRGDEAIYSFAVDRMLETNDWLTPRSSPHEDAGFFEKPPLKFWIVAAPIRAGLLPHDEFGLRCWDALFGAMAFLYVFAIGWRLAGPLCGGVAVLILFVHAPLLGEHGLRSNTMEAPLFLAYCGAVYHFLAWTTATLTRHRRAHLPAVALYFVLGFMTKFVAALFLPLVLGAAMLAAGIYRRRFAEDWRVWIMASIAAVGLIVPWFVYQTLANGQQFWHVLLGEHVFERFTGYLDPQHVQSWHFYFSQIYRELLDSGTLFIVATGALLLLASTVRRRWPEGIVLLLWFGLPLTLISFGTSKLYHYAYPFLPPVALAGGYLFGRVFVVLWPRVDQAMAAVHEGLAHRVPKLTAMTRWPPVRRILLSLAVVALTLAAVNLIHGPVRLRLGSALLFRSSDMFRPTVVALVLAIFAGNMHRLFSKSLLAVLLLALLPIEEYRHAFERLSVESHPLRTARDCLRDLDARFGPSVGPPAVYVDAPNVVLRHEDFYYFRGLRPWERPEEPSDARLFSRLFVESEQRPVLVGATRYRRFIDLVRAGEGALVAEVAERTNVDPGEIRERGRVASVPMVNFGDVLLLVPGAYAGCSAQAAADARAR
jgi:4-amino-4-deoxy-L-arabinose transferase-like glycosyltransferase